MWVVLAEHFTDDTGGFLEGAAGAYSHVVHGEQDAAVDGF